MTMMLSLYGSGNNAKLLAKGGVCVPSEGKFGRQVGGRTVLEIKRRKAR